MQIQRAQRRKAVHALATYMRVLTITSMILVVLRMIVLTSEAYAMIASARSSNGDLLRLCEDGIATNSPHMRTACIQARVEHASPAILRALNSAAFAFCGELYQLAFAPLQALSLAGVLSLMSAVPWLSSLRTALGWGASASHALGEISGAGYEIGLGINGSMSPEHTVYVLQAGDRDDADRTSRTLTRRNTATLTPPAFCDDEF